MRAVIVEKVGPATSVQDAGRAGWQRFGLGPAGAVDIFALTAANLLVGNMPTAAAIEIGPGPAELVVAGGDVRISAYGASRRLLIDGRSTDIGCTAVARPGNCISIGSTQTGVFTYLAFEGGIVGKPALGSMSVHVRSALGCPIPRPLGPCDVLEVGAATPWDAERRLPRSDADSPDSVRSIRFILGPQDDYFSSRSIQQFIEEEWRVSPLSDRMAYRLLGEKLEHAKGHNIVSDGTVNGSIQVLGTGLPLVLLPDRGTTGGYPKLGVVLTADLGRFAQTPAGRRVRFQPVDVREGQFLLRQWRYELSMLRRRIVEDSSLSARLWRANVAGAAVDGIDDDF